MSPTIRTADDGAVRILTVDNPRKRNAFTGAMATTLLAELDRAEADPSVRAVVVTGADGCFSSGHDLQEVLDHPETAGDPVANAAFSRPAEILTPVIAAAVCWSASASAALTSGGGSGIPIGLCPVSTAWNTHPTRYVPAG